MSIVAPVIEGEEAECQESQSQRLRNLGQMRVLDKKLCRQIVVDGKEPAMGYRSCRSCARRGETSRVEAMVGFQGKERSLHPPTEATWYGWVGRYPIDGPTGRLRPDSVVAVDHCRRRSQAEFRRRMETGCYRGGKIKVRLRDVRLS